LGNTYILRCSDASGREEIGIHGVSFIGTREGDKGEKGKGKIGIDLFLVSAKSSFWKEGGETKRAGGLGLSSSQLAGKGVWEGENGGEEKKFEGAEKCSLG